MSTTLEGTKIAKIENNALFLLVFTLIFGFACVAMGPCNCAVIGCTNNSRKLEKWQKTSCETHNGTLKSECCCEAPFRLFCFPGAVRYSEKREKWVRLMKRQRADKSMWIPSSSDRVCSRHFVDGIPTVGNPDPALQLGYDAMKVTPRREVFRHPLPNKRRKIFGPLTDVALVCDSTSSAPPPALLHCPERSTFAYSPASSDHSYCSEPDSKKCESCVDKGHLIQSLTKKIKHLTLENQKLKQQSIQQQCSPFSWRKIKSDQKMNFYTGLTTISTFLQLYELIKPFLPSVQYWRGTKNFKKAGASKVKRKFSRFHLRKLTTHDELFLTLVRLRLGILNEHLADKFGVSPTVCSNTSKTWVRLLAVTLGSSLVCWLPREGIRDNLPEMFKKNGHYMLRCIIDCAEVFVERPKSLLIQAQTWSDYKHHNTFKFLIGISPTGFITFISSCYGGTPFFFYKHNVYKHT